MDFNPFSLKDKTILVTGASSGIGKATAIVCTKMGAKVIATGRNEERLLETVSQFEGEGHFSFIADLQKEQDRNSLICFLKENQLILDGMVHCAGISGHKIFQYLKEVEIDGMFEINYKSPLLITRDCLKKKLINKNASIVFMTSTSGIISSYIGGALYSSTKGALNGLIKGLAIELAPKNIRVNSVMPSMISTPIMNGGQLTSEQFEEDAKKYPLKRYGKPEEVAYAIVYLLSDASTWITGTNLLMDGGRSAQY